ncbi:LPS export ABC transporter permease LptG [Pseudooceanicola sediminis]|uniref:LPS export ABC transporter permease LptG n=1 Tax=Pseudooceanicola sediminis TaxID=2211117 RepID=A0A399J7Y8_9RHOB|nr:LPS export ABC transporter permease LptG [Pseudooceanicola sediminis]KAA2316909.1 LPS export ABC transporter permease LptG [Puniceibacterium sp. HSS470]RII40637.1 LPS export ABC transporter permease LptG [Pseudooceanicola sediminis]|tara:strand:+ start:85044 stop:86159 length:1116 start_codon:yes stop_codon:yes gene_type:complete
MILHLYFARRFLRVFFGIFAVFFLLTGMIDLVEQMRKLANVDVSLGRVLELVLLNIPKGLYDILPLIMILATLTLFLTLGRTSELVVVRAAGRSALHTLVSPLIVAFLIGVLTVAVLNPIVASTSTRYTDLYEQYRSGGADTLSLSAEGLWLRQGGTDGQTVIRAARANPQATELYDVTMLTYAPQSPDGAGGGPVRRIEAAKAQLIRGAWALEKVKVWPLENGVNSEAGAQQMSTYELPSALTEERIRDSFGEPSAIAIWDLPAYIAQLEQAGFSARRHSVWFQMELARPLFLVAMVLIASAFTMRPARFGKTGEAVTATILLGFTLYYIRNFAQVLGENGQIPVLLAAWAPPVASVLLAIGILLQMEDG